MEARGFETYFRETKSIIKRHKRTESNGTCGTISQPIPELRNEKVVTSQFIMLQQWERCTEKCTPQGSHRRPCNAPLHRMFSMQFSIWGISTCKRAIAHKCPSSKLPWLFPFLAQRWEALQLLYIRKQKENSTLTLFNLQNTFTFMHFH